MDEKSKLFAQFCSIVKFTEQNQYEELWSCIYDYIIKDKLTAKNLNEEIKQIVRSH